MHERVEIWTVFLWPALSAMLNIVLRARTAEQWAFMCEEMPRLAAGIRLLRALGVDPAKAIRSVQELVAGGSKRMLAEWSPWLALVGYCLGAALRHAVVCRLRSRRSTRLALPPAWLTATRDCCSHARRRSPTSKLRWRNHARSLPDYRRN